MATLDVVGRSAVAWHAVARDVASAVRSADVVWVDGSRLFLVMPDTDRAGGAHALGRVRGTIAQSRDMRLVVFPEDAWTAEALVESLRRVDRYDDRPLIAEKAS